MRYNVFYGQYPFDKKLGEVDAPEDRPEISLNHAIQIYAGKVPDGMVINEGERYHLHPVIAPA